MHNSKYVCHLYETKVNNESVRHKTKKVAMEKTINHQKDVYITQVIITNDVYTRFHVNCIKFNTHFNSDSKDYNNTCQRKY